eukprot:m.9537 g.9537  ORF g.9537 m.9537 type:complete len:101 (-) comp2982_c0_seq1:29-331(-)
MAVVSRVVVSLSWTLLERPCILLLEGAIPRFQCSPDCCFLYATFSHHITPTIFFSLSFSLLLISSSSSFLAVSSPQALPDLPRVFSFASPCPPPPLPTCE